MRVLAVFSVFLVASQAQRGGGGRDGDGDGRRGPGCWQYESKDLCDDSDDCVFDSDMCRVKDGCWTNDNETSCKSNDRCTWTGNDECISLRGLGDTGGECFQLSERECGPADGCTWITRARGVGYCGREDECRAQMDQAACDSKGDECYWVTIDQFNNRSVCRPDDGVRCGEALTEDACSERAEECVWAERRGGIMRCVREDMMNDTRLTPCVQATGKRQCDELPENMNCGWTTQFGPRTPLGAVGRCLHLSCSELDTEDTCEGNWQCRWDSRRRMCLSDKAVMCDVDSQSECLTQDECRWVWSEVRESNVCQSVCLFHEVRENESLCRTFSSCQWGVGRSGDFRCFIAEASTDKMACRSATDEDTCLSWNDQGAGCFWNPDVRACLHESCESYETDAMCERNFQCRWIGSARACRSIGTFWCNGDDEDTCESQPSCMWAAWTRPDGTYQEACRHDCFAYKSEGECLNDDTCGWGTMDLNSYTTGQGRMDGPRNLTFCRAKAMDSDSSSCALQTTEEDCATFAIAASVGCFWEENRFGSGQCKHEACYDYTSKEQCDTDKYCKFIYPPHLNGRGFCASTASYWCQGTSEQECTSNGVDCGWMQRGDDEADFTCRHMCWGFKDEDSCLLEDSCSWGVTRRGEPQCYFNPAKYETGATVNVKDACVELWTEEECLGAPEEAMCGWLDEGEFREGGSQEGRRAQPGCRHLECFQFGTEEACEADPQCNWSSRREACQSPVDYHCDQIDDEGRCNGVKTCAWNSRVVPRNGEMTLVEDCTHSCRMFRSEEKCNLVVGCGWATAAQGWSRGQCIPNGEASIDQTFCNEMYNEEMCMNAPAALGCAWQYSTFWNNYRCVHQACFDQTNEEACTGMSQCRWRLQRGASTGRCVSPIREVDVENPCREKSEDECAELSDRCVYGAPNHTVANRCMMINDADGEVCKASSETECNRLPVRDMCVWTSDNMCVHQGCRNNENETDCMMDDQCDWVWRTAAQLARFGYTEGAWKCRSKPPCDPETCEAPLCLERGTYLDLSLGCCGQCVPDDCDSAIRSSKNQCKKGTNCNWNQKNKVCQSECIEVTQAMADLDCRHDGLMRAIIKAEDGCDKPQCVRPDEYCMGIKKKNSCVKAGDGKMCAWLGGKCSAMGEGFDCRSLSKKECKDAGLCLVVAKECIPVAAGCDEVDTKGGCKDLDKAHKKSNTGFAGCSWSSKLSACIEN